MVSSSPSAPPPSPPLQRLTLGRRSSFIITAYDEDTSFNGFDVYLSYHLRPPPPHHRLLTALSRQPPRAAAGSFSSTMVLSNGAWCIEVSRRSRFMEAARSFSHVARMAACACGRRKGRRGERQRVQRD